MVTIYIDLKTFIRLYVNFYTQDIIRVHVYAYTLYVLYVLYFFYYIYYFDCIEQISTCSIQSK